MQIAIIGEAKTLDSQNIKDIWLKLRAIIGIIIIWAAIVITSISLIKSIIFCKTTFWIFIVNKSLIILWNSIIPRVPAYESHKPTSNIANGLENNIISIDKAKLVYISDFL